MRYCREKLLHVFLWCFLSKHPVRHPQLETQFDEMGLWSATLQVLLWVECLLAQLSLHVEKRLYGYIQIIWEIRSKCSCCGKEIFSGSNLRILLEMLNIWQLLRILWAVTMGLFPGLISVLLPKCSCLCILLCTGKWQSKLTALGLAELFAIYRDQHPQFPNRGLPLPAG